MVSLVFSVMALCTAIAQFSLGIVAAANDNGKLEDGRLAVAKLSSVPRYDIYYSKQYDFNLCSGSNSGMNWVSDLTAA